MSYQVIFAAAYFLLEPSLISVKQFTDIYVLIQIFVMLEKRKTFSCTCQQIDNNKLHSVWCMWPTNLYKDNKILYKL